MSTSSLPNDDSPVSIPIIALTPVCLRYSEEETGWALPLGGDLYSISNMPLHPNVLRYSDIVRVHDGRIVEIVWRPMTLAGAVEIVDELQVHEAVEAIRAAGLWTRAMIGPYIYFAGCASADPETALRRAGIKVERFWNADDNAEEAWRKSAAKLPENARQALDGPDT